MNQAVKQSVHRQSIRRQLLMLFGPLMFGLWIAGAVLSFWLVSRLADDYFDRDLINCADSIVGRLRVKEGRVTCDLPSAAQALLKHDESDNYYYRVMRPNGQKISGVDSLPEPSRDLVPDTPRIMRTTVSGEKVSLVEILAAPDEVDNEKVVVQFAQTTNARNRFQEMILSCMAVPQLFVVAVGSFAVWLGIGKILTPLQLLQKEVSTRSQFDLSPLPDSETPEEVLPLVRALNSLLARLNEEIRAHQRFITNAAHQLRTPLAGLKTYSSIGLEMSEPADLKHIIQELDTGIDRSTRMVAQLLALARSDAGDSAVVMTKGVVDLNFIVSDVVAELVDRAVRKDIQLTPEFVSESATVYGDRTLLQHLVANLVENAILYTPPGGSVRVNVAEIGALVKLTVSDTGPGIPEEERDKIFERFYRISGTNGNGSGLGLAIVKEVSLAHGGRVYISSADETGTVIVAEFSRHVAVPATTSNGAGRG